MKFFMTFKSHKSHFKKIDDFQSSKLNFLVTYTTQNKNFIVEFFGNLGPTCKPPIYGKLQDPTNKTQIGQ